MLTTLLTNDPFRKKTTNKNTSETQYNVNFTRVNTINKNTFWCFIVNKEVLEKSLVLHGKGKDLLMKFK